MMTDTVTENVTPVETIDTSVNTTTDTTVDTSTDVDTSTEAPTEDDYSWVPKKYLRDGKPDFQAIEKARANLEKKLSQKGVALAPETPDEYDYEFKSGLASDPESSKAFKEEALKMGLSVDQYKFLMEKYEGEMSRYIYTADRAEKELKATWGSDYATNMALANRAFEEYVPSDVSLDEIGNNPAIIKILARIGAELGEDTAPARSTGGRGADMTQAEVEALMMTPEYHDGKSETRRIVNEWFKKNG